MKLCRKCQEREATEGMGEHRVLCSSCYDEYLDWMAREDLRGEEIIRGLDMEETYPRDPDYMPSSAEEWEDYYGES